MDLIVIHNHLNTMNLGILKEKELDLFMSICLKLRDEGTKKIDLQFKELKELSKYEGKDYLRFLNDLRNVNKKLLKLNCEYETETEITGFVLFTEYTIYKTEKKITLQVNEKFQYILNELTENFTKFELNQFVNLTSQYSKNLFRLLKQFSETGWREFLIDEFRELLNIPPKYRISEIDKKVLNEKIIEELKESFSNLKVLKIKKGREVYKIRFEWDTITLLPPKYEKKKQKKESIKNSKEVQAELFTQKQEQDKKNQEINNKFVEEKYLELINQPIEIQELAYNRAYEKFLKESGSEGNRTMNLIFEKAKKPLIIKEFELILEEKLEEEPLISEKQEVIQEEKKEQETKQSLETFEEENPIGWEQKVFIIEPKTEIELEAEKIIKKIFPFLDEELIDEDINYVRSTLRRKKMYKELEIFDLFLEKKQSVVVDPKDIFKDDYCLGLSEFGKEYIEKYIKENNLEHLLISPKTMKELKGSARESRLVKLYKNNFKIN